MKIIIKFIIKNIYEKKFRTFLIVFSIMLSSALFFASNAISNTMVKMYADRMMQYYGSADIVIHAGEKSPSPFMSLSGTESFSDKLVYAAGSVQGSATYKHSEDENVIISLNGVRLEDLQTVNPVTFSNNSGLLPFDGKKIILSQYIADKYGLKVDDYINLDIRGSKTKFRICALTYPTGPFLDESQTVYAIVPLDTLASMYDARGRVNMIYAKTINPQEKQQIINKLSQEYKRYTVREPFTKEEINQQTSSMSTPFFLMSMIVMIISIFIIYTSFKVVTMERLPVIGTFRSIGATRKMTDVVLLVESVIYGVIGGAAGCVLGVGILYVMAIFTRPVWQKGFKATISFTPSQLVFAFLIAVLLSFISCILPITKISRIPVKDIVLNVMDKATRKNARKLVWGLVLLAISLIAPAYTPLSIALPVNSICMFASIAGVILLVPYITAVFVKIFEKFYVSIFGNVGMLAAKNLKENKSILNNISLLAIGIASLLMINTISSCVVTEVANFYRGARFDIWVQYAPQADRSLERIIRQVDGVTETYGIYEAYGVEMENPSGGRISALEGVDSNRYADYWNMDWSEDSKVLLEKLNHGKSIIVSNAIRDNYKLKIGDTVTLRLREISRPYKIVGFVNTMFNNGSFAAVSETNLIMDTGNRFYSNIYIRTSSDPAAVNKDIQKQLAKRPNYMLTVREMEAQNKTANDNMFVILKGFSLLALVIGIFGVLNNLIISFIERRRSLAMFRSVGMSRKQIVKMIFIEALSGGLVGGFTGVTAGFFLIWGVPYVLKAINLTVKIGYPFSSVLYYVAAGVIITIAASISPARKSSRLNLIEAIKYE